jgi:hypothetical protein
MPSQDRRRPEAKLRVPSGRRWRRIGASHPLYGVTLVWMKLWGPLALVLAAPGAHGDVTVQASLTTTPWVEASAVGLGASPTAAELSVTASVPVSGTPQALSWTAASPVALTLTPDQPLPGKYRSLSITAFYGGNSVDRLADDSAYGNRLQAVGSPLAVTFPAAPEGDQWLMGAMGQQGTSERNYFTAPPAIFPSRDGKFIGCIAWTYYYGWTGNVRTPIIEAIDDSKGEYFDFEVGMTKPVFVLEFSPATGQNLSYTPYHGMEFGKTYIIRVECREDCVEVTVNGRAVGEVDHPVVMTRPERVVLGTRHQLEYGVINNLVDGVMVSTNPDEPYPPLKR